VGANRWREWGTIARGLARRALAESQEAVERRRQGHQTGEPHNTPWKLGPQVMAYRPQRGPNGLRKLGLKYDGPYVIRDILPWARTLSLSRVSDGEIRLAHVDNCKPYYPSDLRPETMAEPHPPQPSPAEEQRIIEHVERAVRTASHSIPSARLRATVEHA
jgi:hypothetical protein